MVIRKPKTQVFQVWKIEDYDDVGKPILGEMYSQRTSRTDAEADKHMLSGVNGGRYTIREWWV